MEKKILKDYRLDQVIVCTDAGLSSKSNRKSSDKTINGERLRSFITAQSVMQLPEYLKEFALSPDDWHLISDPKEYNLCKIEEDGKVNDHYDSVFYKLIEISGIKNIHAKRLYRFYEI